MRASVQRARIIEVFGLRDCRMHVYGPKVVGVRGETLRGCKLESRADRVGENVTERIIINYNSYPWGI